MTTLFVSDLHLCPSRPVTAGLFLAFLHECVPGSKALYLLGDIFEYWVGDDALQDDNFSAEICAALKATEVPIYVIVGNRDFLLAQAFCRAAGATLLPEEMVLDIEGVPTLLLHGDSLCTDDTAYMDFRRTVRSSAWQENFLSHPLPARKAQVEALRKQSEMQKQGKSMEIMDANPGAIVDAFRRHGVRHMVHGHTHRLATHQHEVDGVECIRHVLGDWHENPHGGNYLTCSKGQWQRHLWRPQ